MKHDATEFKRAIKAAGLLRKMGDRQRAIKMQHYARFVWWRMIWEHSGLDSAKGIKAHSLLRWHFMNADRESPVTIFTNDEWEWVKGLI